jgi:hypothetical protein
MFEINWLLALSKLFDCFNKFNSVKLHLALFVAKHSKHLMYLQNIVSIIIKKQYFQLVIIDFTKQ